MLAETSAWLVAQYRRQSRRRVSREHTREAKVRILAELKGRALSVLREYEQLRA